MTLDKFNNIMALPSTKLVNHNLLNLITQYLAAWEKDNHDETDRLENLAVKAIKEMNPHLDIIDSRVSFLMCISIFKIVKINKEDSWNTSRS